MTPSPTASPADPRRYITEEGGDQRFTFAELQAEIGDEADEYMVADHAERMAEIDALLVGETTTFDCGAGVSWLRRVA